MKLSIAGNHLAQDFDLSDTHDVRPSYSDIVTVFQADSVGAHEVAQAWLNHREEA